MSFDITARTGGPAVFDINTVTSDFSHATDYLDHALKYIPRLLEQFRGDGTPLIQALVNAPLDYSTSIDAVGADLRELRWLDSASGEQLDAIGRILGIDRKGLSDSRFRTAIAAEKLVLRSNGTIDEIYAPLDVWAPTNDAVATDLPLDSASIRISITAIILDDENAEIIRVLIARSRMAGVKIYFYSWPADGDTLFTFSSGGSIESDSARGFDAGGLAREDIA